MLLERLHLLCLDIIDRLLRLLSLGHFSNLLINTLRLKFNWLIDLDISPQVIHIININLFRRLLVLLLFPSPGILVLSGFFFLDFGFGFGLLDDGLLNNNGLYFGFVSEIAQLHSFSLGLVFGVVS